MRRTDDPVPTVLGYVVGVAIAAVVILAPIAALVAIVRLIMWMILG